VTPNDKLVKAHYEGEATRHGEGATSTMEDTIIRDEEIAVIVRFLGQLGRQSGLKILDLGCGNGYALGQVTKAHPGHQYWGLDFSEALMAIAKSRGLACDLRLGDARALPYADRSFDGVYTERCIINLLEPEDQVKALAEIHRVLVPGGHYLMIEAFADGLEASNRARAQLGLEPIQQPYHNRWLDRASLFSRVSGLELVGAGGPGPKGGASPSVISNFLSSYYFMSRVIYPAVTRAEVVRNSEFVKFFHELLAHLPPAGNYAPIQAYVFRKKD
jgi:ubiquinone/menaquinone biosynthesis C-methylase UbiE